MKLKVYLSGEIHSNWRSAIAEGIKTANLDIELSGPNTDHAASDDCGDMILGAEEKPILERSQSIENQWFTHA